LYRSLGIVVVGGLISSTIFTLLVVPTMMSLVNDVQTALASRRKQA
jgi:Cu/Ag efflux pump CusA